MSSRHLLARGDLVPVGSVIKTGRTCELVTARNPQKPVVVEICDWIADEFNADMERINERYPDLGLLPAERSIRRA